MADYMHDPAVPDTPSPIPGIVVADHSDYPPGTRARRRAGTRDWLITYTIGGVGSYRSGDATYAAQPGDVILLPPGVPHDYGAPGDRRWELYWAHFLPRAGWAHWLDLPLASGGLRRLTIGAPVNQARIVAAFGRVVLAARPRGATSDIEQELALNALEEILLLCSRERRHEQPSALDPRVREVLDAIGTDLARAYRVADLAAHVSLSPSRLAHLFKVEVGASIVELLLEMRLQQAARLLTHTAYSVRDIARTVGFHSAYYFSRQFRRRFGRSPRAYRDALQPRE